MSVENIQIFRVKRYRQLYITLIFYYPDGSEVYLGIANGLNECGNISGNFASSKNLLENNDWSYVCCMKAKGSECYEKHR